MKAQRIKVAKESAPPQTIDLSVIESSLKYLADIPLDPDRECTTEEERAAIMEYEGGLSRDDAERMSGWSARQPSIDELAHLRALSPFAATMVVLTRPSILADWYIGKDRSGAILFWYRNISGRFLNAKRIAIGEDGFHRNKDIPPTFLYKGTRQCLYGEHQLNPQFVNHLGKKFDSDTPIMLVESEKTAVIMSHHEPDSIWLATGGAKGLTVSKAKVLHNREILIWYDNDASGEKGARQAAEILRSVRAKTVVVIPASHDRPQGSDLADGVYEEYWKSLQ